MQKPQIVSPEGELTRPAHGLGPIVDGRTRFLVLGTFPALESLDEGFYYRNQIKRFWGQALKAVGEFELLDNDARRKLLLENKIGLWDIFGCVERNNGNQDDRIRKAKYNDIHGLLEKSTSIQYLIFNGRNAYDWLKEDRLDPFQREMLRTRRLQSSSGSNGWFNHGVDWFEFFSHVGFKRVR